MKATCPKYTVREVSQIFSRVENSVPGAEEALQKFRVHAINCQICHKRATLRERGKAQKIVRLLEENLPWPTELEIDKAYERTHDDTDGSCQGKIRVGFKENGDAWISTDTHRGPVLRFRSSFGGGGSLRVRNALIILALAIKCEEDDEAERAAGRR